MLNVRAEQEIAIGAIYLSSKLTENQVRLRDLLNAYILHVSRSTYLRNLDSDQLARYGQQLHGQLPSTPESDTAAAGFDFTIPGYHHSVFYDLKDAIVVSEMQILKRLGFEMQVS